MLPMTKNQSRRDSCGDPIGRCQIVIEGRFAIARVRCSRCASSRIKTARKIAGRFIGKLFAARSTSPQAAMLDLPLR